MKSKTTVLCGAALLLWSALSSVQGQSVTFAVLHTFSATNDFTNSDGADPSASLLLSGNTIYGTAASGGTGGGGSVFGFNADGLGFTNLHSFVATTGDNPQAPLIVLNNALYGTATAGSGVTANGTVFRVNTDGTSYTNLENFTGSMPDPESGLTVAGGSLYGTELLGGAWTNGAIFSLTTNSSIFRSVYSFSAGDTNSDGLTTNFDGAEPAAGLIIAGSTLYGTATLGGTNGNGNVFSVNTNGFPFKDLYSFSALATNSDGFYTNGDGANPSASLILSGQTLYGTTLNGGTTSDGAVFAINTNGTGFTNLYSFSAGNFGSDGVTYTNSDGADPQGGLLLVGSILYGTTTSGGASGNGSIFAISTNGMGFANLHTFSAGGTNSAGIYTNLDGADPLAGLILAGHTLYGTASLGGTNGNGTVFALALPVPILEFVSTSQKVILSWQSWATNFVLQTGTNLSSENWSNITSGIGLTGTNYLFTNALTGPAAFFRLARQ